MKPKQVENIEIKAWSLVNRRWKKFNPESPVLFRLRIQWEEKCKETNYNPHYNFDDILA